MNVSLFFFISLFFGNVKKKSFRQKLNDFEEGF